MPKIKNIEKKIWDIEGFDVRIKHSDGKDVRGDLSISIQYDKYEKQAKNDFTVAEWKEKRFSKTFSGYKVDVLLANGEPADGRCKLSTVRDTYIEE